MLPIYFRFGINPFGGDKSFFLAVKYATLRHTFLSPWKYVEDKTKHMLGRQPKLQANIVLQSETVFGRINPV